MTLNGPDDWSALYREGSIPWDLGRAHPELVQRLTDLGPPGTAVVPGAGRGHDAAALAAAGWRVTAVDFSPAVADDLRRAVGPDGRVVIGDVFEFTPPDRVDLVFDHTFFCTLPLDRRADFGRWADEVVRREGRLASVVFPIDRPATDVSPPYPMAVADLAAALDPAFTLEVDEPADKGGRRWETRWAALRHR